MAWVVLLVAGMFETVMALSLKESHGFSRLWPSIGFAVFGTISFLLLSYALRTLPVGTAYAVWTGIGAAGTAILGILLFGEPRDVFRLVSIALIITGVIGLRFAPGSAA
jgi:quaternary ammonium compound-resistance protein SugE